jgi:cation transport regulator
LKPERISPVLKKSDVPHEAAPMPYASNDDLPPAVRDHLPEHAQDIFRAAFNAAHEKHGDEADGEEIAFRIAWAAVKRGYEKRDGHWVARPSGRGRA